ncbi:hypothetical protein QUB10_31985 [Microcoleus sp. B5-D4]|uniref:hypothetical protein n=1 Tax=unclassified Microcoleus TaxID=2642155 RepID=UPI002FD36EF0
MYTYTATQLEHKTFGELKAIARDLDIVPSADRRCRQAWIDAIVGVELPLLALITFPGVETDSVQEPMAPAAKTSPGVEIDATQLEHKTFGELKAIARQLNVVLSGDSRKKRTWELAIAAQAQIMDISIDAACNPILRTYCLGGRNGFTSEAIEQALDLVERHCYPSVFRLKTTPTEPIENSPGAQLAAKVLPGIARFQNFIELALTETSPGTQIDPVQEPIDLNTGKIFPLQEAIDLNTGKIFPLQEAIDLNTGKIFPLQEAIDLNTGKIFPLQEAIAPAAKTSPGVTFSDRFLALYFPPQPEIHYQTDADGQLTLFDFEVVAIDEPPDPDDFACLDDFFEAMAAWDAENLEPVEVSLDSMIYWAPCPSDWYEPPDTGIFSRLFGPKPPKFPPSAIGQTDDIASVSSSHSGRSPPGGDAVF